MPQPLSGIPVLGDVVLGTFGALGCAEIDIHSFSFPWRPRQSGDLCLPGPFGGPASFCDTSVPHPTPKRQPRLPAVFRRFCPRKPCFGNLLAPAHPLVYSLMLPYPPVFTRKYDKSRPCLLFRQIQLLKSDNPLLLCQFTVCLSVAVLVKIAAVVIRYRHLLPYPQCRGPSRK